MSQFDPVRRDVLKLAKDLQPQIGQLVSRALGRTIGFDAQRGDSQGQEALPSLTSAFATFGMSIICRRIIVFALGRSQKRPKEHDELAAVLRQRSYYRRCKQFIALSAWAIIVSCLGSTSGPRSTRSVGPGWRGGGPPPSICSFACGPPLPWHERYRAHELRGGLCARAPR